MLGKSTRMSLVGRRVDVESLLSAQQVAEIIGLSNRNGVSVYQRRYPDFPAPVVSQGRCRLWVIDEIKAWAESHSPLPGEVSE